MSICAPAGSYFQPISADMLNINETARAAKWNDVMMQPYETRDQTFYGDSTDFAPPKDKVVGAQNAAIAGAASKLIDLFFCYQREKQFSWCNAATGFIQDALTSDETPANRRAYPTQFQQGEDIAVVVRSSHMTGKACDKPTYLMTVPVQRWFCVCCTQLYVLHPSVCAASCAECRRLISLA